jgi:hypothetical protein
MAKQHQAADETLKQAKGSGTQTIFNTDMEAIGNFYIIKPPREHTPGILIVGNYNPPPIQYTRSCATAPPNNINATCDYFEDYSHILQCLIGNTINKHELAKVLIDKQATLIQTIPII